MTIRVAVIDDQEIVRAGFAALLGTQEDFRVVGTAADGEEAVELCSKERPHVVLMDVRMPVMDGIEATRQVTANGKRLPRVIMLTTFDLDEYVYDALGAGASGFLLKDVTAETLFDAVRVVAAGDALLAPGVTRRLVAEFARLRPALPSRPDALSELTPRETEVLRLVAEGLSNGEIAERLVVSDETVKTHVSRVLSKLGVRDRTQAVVVAYESRPRHSARCLSTCRMRARSADRADEDRGDHADEADHDAAAHAEECQPQTAELSPKLAPKAADLGAELSRSSRMSASMRANPSSIRFARSSSRSSVQASPLHGQRVDRTRTTVVTASSRRRPPADVARPAARRAPARCPPTGAGGWTTGGTDESGPHR